MDISKKIYELGIVPVVKLDSAEDAIPLAKALYAGGLRIAEITFRTDAAEESIRRISSQMPEMLVGAGTVLTTEQVDKAVAAGAKFIVTPGFNLRTAKYCVDKGIPIYPGCSTPDTIEAALELGLNVLKFFPAEASGGLDMIKALCGPYTTVKFMPTGGISENNLNDYLAFEKIVACGGTWMVKDSLIKAGKFDEIERITRESIFRMLGFELRHVGINCPDAGTAMGEAKKFGSLFGWDVKEGNSSIFAGTAFEMMKQPYLGANGHLAIAVNSVDRAYAYLSSLGYEFQDDTIQRDAKGRLKVIYLAGEIGGFAVHLVNK